MMENINIERSQLNDELMVNALEQNIAIIRFDKNKRVTYVNDNFANVLGYHKEELYGKEHKIFCFPEFLNSPEYEELWENLLNGVSFQDKIMRRSASVEVVWLEATYFPIFNEEKTEVVGVAKVATDITERQTQIEKVTNDLLTMSSKLTEASEEGIGKGQELLAGNQEMINLSKESTVNLNRLQDKSNSIKSIVRTIQDIASNTNLLAINASIEAAHAGEYGLGFGVIAQEVKNLSQKVHESAYIIGEDISAVTDNIDVVVKGNNVLQNQILVSEEEINGTINEFNRISTESNYLQKQATKLETII